ncbi:MAG: aldo/keto reductase [Myxococcales bacterium]|nr:aldo/keto reductase [Myxococcales bacterium]
MRRALGQTGIMVSPIGLGGMPMSIVGRPDSAQSHGVIHAAIEGGMDFIDTADVYCMNHEDIGHNERLIAEALAAHPRGAEVVVATKGGLERPNGQWTRNGHPDHLQSACEASLQALGTECITLYQLHAPDPEVPFAESVGALQRLQEAGKIAHVGLSNVRVEQIQEAQSIVEVVSVQNRCNIIDRSAFSEGVVAYCEAQQIAFLPYCPVGGRGQKEALGSHPLLTEIASRFGASPQQVALAWLLQQSPVIIPIPGASKAANASSSAQAQALALGLGELIELNQAFPTEASDTGR